jgi:hypothetical protein
VAPSAALLGRVGPLVLPVPLRVRGRRGSEVKGGPQGPSRSRRVAMPRSLAVGDQVQEVAGVGVSLPGARGVWTPLVAERLSPVERAIYVLREAFDYPFRDIAEALQIPLLLGALVLAGMSVVRWTEQAAGAGEFDRRRR